SATARGPHLRSWWRRAGGGIAVGDCAGLQSGVERTQRRETRRRSWRTVDHDLRSQVRHLPRKAAGALMVLPALLKRPPHEARRQRIVEAPFVQHAPALFQTVLRLLLFQRQLREPELCPCGPGTVVRAGQGREPLPGLGRLTRAEAETHPAASYSRRCKK